MPRAKREEGDPELRELFERFNGWMISPGGAAQLLGVSRKTIYTLGERGKLRVFHSSKRDRLSESGAKWTYIPMEDVERYARAVGRPFPNFG